MSVKVGMISLGCAKNLVNSEQMLHLLKRAGYELCPEPGECAAVVINTCGFIASAESEAIENILDIARIKAERPELRIIVAGCMAERRREEIFRELPEVDGVLGCGSFGEIVGAVEEALRGGRPALFGDVAAPYEEGARVLTTPKYTAYLKVADGCDNRCSYCVIPSLRGPFKSRRLEDIVSEAEKLSDDGVRELILIAQDTTRYGLDLYGSRRLPELLRRLLKVSGIEWIRLHYLYPDEVTDELIDICASEPKILKYLDIPIQHISDRVLRDMNRRATGAEIRGLISTLRERIPGLVLRTSVIVGFPGETEEEFRELCDFLRETGIERAGVFAFSPEEGAPAELYPNQVDDGTKARRVEIVSDIQARVMDDYNAGMKGKIIRVLCEGRDGDLFFGRSYADSSDVDGRVLFSSEKTAGEGTFVSVRITGTLDGDLTGEAI